MIPSPQAKPKMVERIITKIIKKQKQAISKDYNEQYDYSGVPNNHTGMLIYFGQKSRGVLFIILRIF